MWGTPCSRVIFSQKSPFAVTIHTFGVRGICIPAPTGPTVIAKGATGTLVSAAPKKTPRALKGRTESPSSPTRPRAPFQGANDVWVAPCSRVIFSQKSPFAVTVHTFGVRAICIPAPTGPTVIAKGAAGTLVSAAPQNNTPRPEGAHGHRCPCLENHPRSSISVIRA